MDYINYVISHFGMGSYFLIGVFVWLLSVEIVDESTSHFLIPAVVLIVPAWPGFILIVAIDFLLIKLEDFIIKTLQNLKKITEKEIS